MKIDDLFEIIKVRAESDPEFSWTASYYHKDQTNALRNLGKLSKQIAATKKNKSELIHETADLLYHLVVMLHANRVTLTEITDELRA